MDTFNIMFPIIISRIKNDDQKILKHFYFFVENKHLTNYSLSIEDFKVCATKLSTHTFTNLCNTTHAFDNETCIKLILQLFRDDRKLLFEPPYSEPGLMNGGYGKGYEYYELGRHVENSITSYFQYHSDEILKACLLYNYFPINKLEKALFNDDMIRSTIEEYITHGYETKIVRLLYLGTLQLRSDCEFIQKVVDFYGQSLVCADKSLLDNKEFLLKLSKKSAKYIVRYCSDRLKKEKEFIMSMLLNIDCISISIVYTYLDKKLRIQPDVLTYCISKNKEIIRYLNPDERQIYLHNK